MRIEWPLVGRAGELRRLEYLVDSRAARGVVLAGSAGVGKTRLAVECVTRAKDSEFFTVRVTATLAARGLPLGAFGSLVPAATDDDASYVDDRIDLLRRSASALIERAGKRRLFLMVDDAHLLDDTSAVMIHHLVVTGAAFVLVTLRTGEPVPDPIVALWKDDELERIEVTGLDIDAVQQLLHVALGGPVDGAVVYELNARCEGNVLFLRELVLGGLVDGSLANREGIWRLVEPLSPSDRLVELVDKRLGSLNDSERALLEIVSFGEPLGRAELTTLSSPEVAEELERKGLISARLEQRRLQLRFAHPLYGDVLRARIPIMRAQAICRDLADVVERSGLRRREDVLRVATWRLEGGDARPNMMLAAAHTARWRYDFPLAERLARAAATYSDAGFDAALLAARLLLLQGRCSEAETELAALTSQASDDAQRGQIAITRIENLAFNLGRLDEALRVAADSDAAIADPAWRDEIAARRCGVLCGTEGPRAGATAARHFLNRSEGRALVWASHSGAHALVRLGKINEAVDATIRGYTAHVTLSEPLDWYPWLHLVFRCQALAAAGRFHDAEAMALERYHQGLASRSAEQQAWFAWHLVQSYTQRGHVRTAVNYGREAVALFHQLDRPQMAQWCLIYLVWALALAGEHEEVNDALDAMDQLPLSTTHYMGVDELQARAWSQVAQGDLRRAVSVLHEAADRGEKIGDRLGVASALYGLARLGEPKEVADRLVHITAEIEGDLVKAWVAHTVALAAGDVPGLERASATLEAMGADLFAAEAAADAAVASRRADLTKQAGANGRRTRELAGRCQGAITPALGSTAARSSLTPAERETAALAATGYTNRQIAAKLCVSVRTIESRLFHAYQKLGVTGRGELAATL